MCRFASFVLTKDKVFWLPYSNSHLDIIDHFKLHESGAMGPNIVKAEIRPTDKITKFNQFSKWAVNFDQDLLPAWYDPETSERRVRAALRKRAKEGFKYVDASGCVALTELRCDAAEYVDASGCAALTELRCDAAKHVDVSGCVALTELRCDAAKYVNVSGCAALTELRCDAAEHVDASGCVALPAGKS